MDVKHCDESLNSHSRSEGDGAEQCVESSFGAQRASGPPYTYHKGACISLAESDRYLGCDRVKVIALVLVLSLIGYHSLMRVNSGGDSCEWLLSNGRLQGNNEWQPYGCMMHNYTRSDARECMRYASYWNTAGGRSLLVGDATPPRGTDGRVYSSHVVFVGDSRIRQLFYEFLRSFVSHQGKQQQQQRGGRVGDEGWGWLEKGRRDGGGRRERDRRYSDESIGLLVEFFWQPMVDESMVQVYRDWMKLKPDQRPTIIVTSNSVSALKTVKGERKPLQTFKDNLMKLLPLMDQLNVTTKILWLLQEPMEETLLPDDHHSLTNHHIDLYNLAAINAIMLSGSESTHIWSSHRLISQSFLSIEPHEPAVGGVSTDQGGASTDMGGASTDQGGANAERTMMNHVRGEANNERGRASGNRGGAYDVKDGPNSDRGGAYSERGGANSDTGEIEMKGRLGGKAETTGGVPGSHRTDERRGGAGGENNSTGQSRKNREAELVEPDSRGAEPERVELEVIDRVLRVDVQLLLNLYCNDRMNHDDSTCCSRLQSISYTQISALIISSTLCLIGGVVFLWQSGNSATRVGGPVEQVGGASSLSQLTEQATPTEQQKCQSSDTQELGTEDCLCSSPCNRSTDTAGEVLLLVARLSAILIYFFLCDRTKLFMNESKHFTHVGFLLPFLYLLVLGFFFTEKTKQVYVLGRDQTDEWKGWMQLVILLYLLTGGSSHLSINAHISIFVSAYLFISGYGHASYFITKADMSLNRYLTVLLRMNLLGTLLCVVMNRSYQFYFFLPLVSLWFTALYLIFSLPPRLPPAPFSQSSQYASSSSVSSSSSNGNSSSSWWWWSALVMTVKLATAWSATAVLYKYEVLFERLFSLPLLSSLFLSSDLSLTDWRSRWELDRYSALYGATFAAIVAVARSSSRFNDLSKNRLLNSGWFTTFVSGLSGVGLLIYGILVSSQISSKAQYNSLHPHTSIIPVLLYVCLRNASSRVRSYLSTFFAWHGRFSLELYLSQYHIWLSHNGRGVLVVVGDYPGLNLVLTTLLFVCVSHELHYITDRLLPCLLPCDSRLLARNIVCITALTVLYHVCSDSVGAGNSLSSLLNSVNVRL